LLALNEQNTRPESEQDGQQHAKSEFMVKTDFPSSLGIRGLSFSYDGTAVFRDFSFFSEARVLLFRGPSGCGKTTLLKIISGNLTPDCADEMSVPNHAFMILQEDALAPWLTGISNITRFVGVSEDCVRAHPGFEHVKSFLFKRAHQMSYGQRRLVELLRAFLSSPGLLCLDEPFSFLDPTSRRIFTRLLLEEDSYLGNSRIVITSHYQEDFEDTAVEAFGFNGLLPVSSLIALNKGDKL
ncbi:MAG: ATP-binding cassette domain-containing protein, partial [bacterium]